MAQQFLKTVGELGSSESGRAATYRLCCPMMRKVERYAPGTRPEDSHETKQMLATLTESVETDPHIITLTGRIGGPAELQGIDADGLQSAQATMARSMASQ